MGGADQQQPRRRGIVLLARVCLFYGLLRLAPFHRQVVVGVGKAWTGLLSYRGLATVAVILPGNLFQPGNRLTLVIETRVVIAALEMSRESGAGHLVRRLAFSDFYGIEHGVSLSRGKRANPVFVTTGRRDDNWGLRG